MDTIVVQAMKQSGALWKPQLQLFDSLDRFLDQKTPHQHLFYGALNEPKSEKLFKAFLFKFWVKAATGI